MFIETLKGIAQYKFFNFIIVIQLALGMVLCNMVMQQRTVIDDEIIRYAPLWDGSNIYMVYDELRGMKEQEYFDEQDSQFRVQRYVDALEDNTAFEYLICGQHPINILDTNLPEATIYGETTDLIKAHQVNKNLMLRYPISTIEGRIFTNEDYNYRLLDVVPIILGYSFKGFYEVGTRFGAVYMGRLITFEVIGIAEQASYFPLYDYLMYEDDFIIMPTYRIANMPLDDDEVFLQKANALQNTTGYFRLTPDQNLADLVDYLSSVGSQFGMYEVKVGRIDSGRLVALGLSSTNKKTILMSFAAIVLLFSFVQLLVIIFASVRKSAHRFSILFLAGASKMYIASLIVCEVLILMFLSFALSLVITYYIGRGSINIQYPVVILLTICGVGCSLPALYQLFQSPILYLNKY